VIIRVAEDEFRTFYSNVMFVKGGHDPRIARRATLRCGQCLRQVNTRGRRGLQPGSRHHQEGEVSDALLFLLLPPFTLFSLFSLLSLFPQAAILPYAILADCAGPPCRRHPENRNIATDEKIATDMSTSDSQKSPGCAQRSKSTGTPDTMMGSTWNLGERTPVVG
jgi:hypothetical protein